MKKKCRRCRRPLRAGRLFCSRTCKALTVGARSSRLLRLAKASKDAPPGADWIYIPLTKGKFAKISIQDAALDERCWVYDGKYASRHEWGKPKIYLHRAIMNPPEGFEVDHINRDPLDCRRQNLRLATRSQNIMNYKRRKNNTSGHRGVYWSKQRQKWQAMVNYQGRAIHAGFFDDKQDAVNARNVLAKKLYGDFALPA